MRVGVFYFPTDYGIHPSELARELEARGFESLFVCEHTHIPVGRRTPFSAAATCPSVMRTPMIPSWHFRSLRQRRTNSCLVRASAWLSNTIPS